MLKTLLALVAVAAIVSGCASERTGADFLAMSQKMGPPRAGHSRIVVLREKGYGGITDTGWDVKLDGGPMADLKTGTYVYADRPAGRHELSASADLFPGISKREFAAAPGKTYFFLTRPSDRAKALHAMSAAGGVAGLVIGAAVTSNNDNPGPLDFFPMEEAEARTMINDLRLAP